MIRTAAPRHVRDPLSRLWEDAKALATVLTNVGREIITGRLLVTAPGAGNPGSAAPQYVAWGTGAGTSAVGDTTLFTEDTGGSPAYARVAGTTTQQTTSVTNDTWQCVGTLTANAAKTITNMGVFDALTGGNLFIKGDFTGIALALNESIQATCTYQIQ